MKLATMRWTATATALTLIGVAGCSSSDDPDQPSSNGSSAEAATSSGAAGAFPLTIDTMYGESTIESAPERVVTWGWSNQDAILALGVVPVAMPDFSAETFGPGPDGLIAWDSTKIAELGGTKPTILTGDGTGGVPVEEITAADPDLIFAPYSGITEAEFKTLSQIAPVVAPETAPWTATWQEQLESAGQALGKSAEAAALVESTNQEIADAVAEYPALAGKTVTLALPNPNNPGNIAVTKPSDPRAAFIEQLGLTLEPTILENDPDKSGTATTFDLSYEKADLIVSDLLWVAGYTKDQINAFLAEPVIAGIPAVAEDRTATSVGFTNAENYAYGGLTVLSIPYLLPKLTTVLNDAALNVG